jgi:hypothetical protein
VASAVFMEGSGMLGAIVGSVGSILGRMQEFAKTLIEKLIELAKEFVKWFLDIVREHPEDAVMLALIVTYWLSPY